MEKHDQIGVVLAGGYSTRFGGKDKALAAIDGTPMVARVIGRLAGVVDKIVVSCRANQQQAIAQATPAVETPTQFALDPEPDRGPLAGIIHSFKQVDAAYAAVVACDMPFVSPEFIDFLFKNIGEYDAVVPKHKNGYNQPTQAVYDVSRTTTVGKQRLAAGNLSLHGALSALDTRVLPPSIVSAHTTWRSFQDINTRDAFEAINLSDDR